MFDQLDAALSTVREMKQFGAGVTFKDLLLGLREVNTRLESIWPWVKFDPEGHLKCTPFPTPASADFEVLLVYATEKVDFPANEDLGFILDSIEQIITVLKGELVITYLDKEKVIKEHEMVIIPKGTLVSFSYSKDGLFLFQQKPTMADEEHFQFLRFEDQERKQGWIVPATTTNGQKTR